MKEVENRKQWSSSFGFVIACVGSAVGLGNIWKFPYITYENGGGAFVMVYLLAVVVVGFPIIVAEMLLGRHAGMNAYGTFKKLSKNNLFWKGVGLLCVFSSFIILSYYSVVAGWTLDYFISSITGELGFLTSDTAGIRFGNFVSCGWKQIVYHSAFMLATALIVLKGTSSIEKAVKLLMPSLTLLIIVIAGISIYNYGSADTLTFLFNFDFSKLTGQSILEATGHAFFTLSLGLGCMLVYGSYLPKNVSLVKAGIWITCLDTLIALLACLMIYPIIFGTGMDVKESAAILFTTLSLQFNALPGGAIVSALFYLLVAFAALSSTISLLEPVVSFIDETFNIKRSWGVIVSALAIWFVGLGSALGNGAVPIITSWKLMDRLDYLASNWTLPIGGMLISLFTAWTLSRRDKLEELSGKERGKFYVIWNFSIKFISPALVFIVIIYKLGLF